MLPHLASAPNINHLWAGLLIEELVRQGTTFFVVCPGSRSTPLAVAVAQNPRAEALVHWDERAAAFVALGWGRATGRPAAVVTTSGTAVANLLPAAVEADADGVPMLLLTADRPPELRETGANQTVRQPPVFQDVARWALDWPVPTTDVPARWVLSTAAHAAHRAAAPPGPVHLNLPFREPLGAQPDGTDAAAYLGGVETWAEPGTYRGRPRPYSVAGAGVSRGPSDLTVFSEWAFRVAAMSTERRGVIVVGPGVNEEFQAGVWAVRAAQRMKWPLLPDALSGLRTGTSARAPFAPEYDLVLASPQAREALKPRVVIHVGGRPTSKRLLQLLSDAQPELYLRVQSGVDRKDPGSLVTHRVRESPARAFQRLAGLPDRYTVKGRWLDLWRCASGAAWRAVQPGLDEDLSEPAVARAVTRLARTGVIVGASMPIRDVDAYADRSGRALRIVANRGASGIDGTVATATGFARGRGGAGVALVGDLALLHDQTSLALLRSGPPVVVVVVNNDGGGIFHRLPIADEGGAGALVGDTFERFFGTPHGLGFEDAARQVGLAYHRPETMPAFETALDEAVRSGASALIEVRTDREEQAALRRRIEAAAAAAVDAALAAPPGGDATLPDAGGAG